ncbi:MAG: hypothetical protein ACRBFS_02705 [Aureispira sp.]
MRKASNRLLNSILLALWALLGLALLGSFLYTGSTSYEQFTTTLLQSVHKLDWRPYFQQAVLPLERYAFLPYLLGGGFFFWLVSTPSFWRKSQYGSRLIASFFRQSQHQQWIFWRARSHQECFFLSFIIGVASLRMFYYMGHYALQYDEAWTYNHFISNGFLVAAISPNNNHILYTLLACITDWLPISGQYSLRLPVLFGGGLLLLAFYKLARQSSTTTWALLSVTFLAFAPAASLYSLYARGYIFQLLFTLLVLSSTWHLLSTTNKRAYHWTWWRIAQILGLYSVPTHAYVLLLSSAFLGWKGRTNRLFLKHWLSANLAILGCCLFLYAPYFITNGGRVLWAAASQGSSGEALWSYQDKVADWLLWGGGRGTPVYSVWLGLIAVLGLLYYKKIRHKKTAVLAELVLLFLCLPTLLNLCIGAQPPYRIWCFLSPFLAFWLLLVGEALFSNWQAGKGLLLVLLILISGYSWRMEKHYALQWSAQLDWQVHAIAEQLLEANIKACYLFSNYDKPLLEYYYLRQGQRLKTWMVSPKSKDYAPFERQPLYEAVLWDAEDRVASPAERAWLQQHYPVVLYQGERVQVYLPKSLE